MTQATTSSFTPTATGTRPRSGRPGRAVGVFVAAILVAVLTYVAGPVLRPGAEVAGEPLLAVPGDVAPLSGGAGAAGATVDGRLPVADRLAFWAARVEAAPDDYLSLVQLALVKAEQARETSDIDGYQRALADVDRSLAIIPAYPPTIRARGSIRYALHDFVGALGDADTVLEVSPSDATALAVRGDALLELGRPDEAAAAYDRLVGIAPGPWLDVRFARLASATGEGDRALSLARKAFAIAPSVDPGEVAFYGYALGEYARLAGDVDAARAGFEAALAERPTDVAALVGLARIDAFDGRPAAAIAGFRAAADVVPQPETLAILGDLLEATGDPAAAEAAFETVRFIRELGSIQGAVYDRQLIRFELDHGGASAATLAAARASLATRPDAAGHDLVAWALYRLGRVDEAAAEILEARDLGADDARLRFHDGTIAVARGDRSGGIALLQGALADGPALDPIERAEALRLMR
ncbi:MAG: tetratricopeptide repeat protein [Chloroflexota bacterium]